MKIKKVLAETYQDKIKIDNKKNLTTSQDKQEKGSITLTDHPRTPPALVPRTGRCAPHPDRNPC
jgi:hypothetical protein